MSSSEVYMPWRSMLPKPQSQARPHRWVSMLQRTSFSSPALFALAPNGTLAFVPARDASKRHLVWVDRSGGVEALANLSSNAYAAPRISPDGQKVMVFWRTLAISGSTTTEEARSGSQMTD